jgi:hypothetical protein
MLLSEKRRLNPNFRRGYATVRLPIEFRAWYMDSLKTHKVLLSFPLRERWKKLALLSPVAKQ